VPARLTGPVVAAATAIVLVTGCALPAGVDGDLTGGWAGMPEPVVFAPDPGTCHYREYRDTVPRATYVPVDCDDGYRFETVHVGEFVGEAADRVTPPPPGSPELQEAYRECDAVAAEYLGADFRHGRLWLGVARPSELAWNGGARWFRCDVGVWRAHGEFNLIRHYGSLRGALAGDSEIALGCYDPDIQPGRGILEMNPVDCDEPHTAEFVGVWTASDTSYMNIAVDEDSARIHRGCRSVVAAYVGVPDDGDLRFRTGTIAWPVDPVDWAAGDRGFRCYLWLDDDPVSRSLAGASTSGLPIN
jgi:hypothetical protein